MKKCPNCNKIYRDFDQYCLVCRYKLKYIEGTEKVEYCPNPTGNNFTNPSNNTKLQVTCPYCHSIDTKKISGLSKAGSVVLFGIFSQKVKKQWHCNKCGSDF